MKKLFFLLLVSIGAISANAQNNSDIREWTYEIEGVAQSRDVGTYIVKVWSYTKKSKIDYDIAKRNAIHGIIFRGYLKKGNLPALPPISNSPGLDLEKSANARNLAAEVNQKLPRNLLSCWS